MARHGAGRRPDTPAERVLQLQRQAGNAAVSAMLRPVQRSCACAGKASPCASCAGTEEEAAPVQRYARCMPARLSMQECPPRGPGERDRARAGPMVFLGQLRLPAVNETGVLIANFDIGSAAIKPNLHGDYFWKSFLAQLMAGHTTWRIEGFSDCQGNESRNKALRASRANAVLALLPPALRPRITDVDGATAGDCMTDNTNGGDRALNRSVAIILVESSVDMDAETITDSLERKTPRTDGCTDAQRERMSLAYPMARRMGENAMATIGSMTRGSPHEALLKKFFGPDAFAERFHIKQNYSQALNVFESDPKYKCVAQGTDPCTGGTEAYVGAHAIIVGNPTIVCSSAFTQDVIELADTILHEATHLGAWTNDLEYCSLTSGCHLDTTDEKVPGIKLSDRGAVNNADSYGRFASSLFR